MGNNNISKKCFMPGISMISTLNSEKPMGTVFHTIFFRERYLARPQLSETAKVRTKTSIS